MCYHVLLAGTRPDLCPPDRPAVRFPPAVASSPQEGDMVQRRSSPAAVTAGHGAAATAGHGGAGPTAPEPWPSRLWTLAVVAVALGLVGCTSTTPPAPAATPG